MKKWHHWIIISILLSALFSQQKNLSLEFIDKGFENLYTETKDENFILVYENRIYRSELKAMGTILNILQESEQVNDKIRLIPLNRGIPLVSVDFEQNDDLWEVTQVSLKPDYMSNSPENTSFSFLPVTENWRKNSSFGKWEITLIPDINARFHTGDGLIRLKLNAVAEAAVTFGKGLKIVSQAIAPIYYEYHKEIAEIKPGSSYLNYTMRLKNNVWVSTSAGIFHWKSQGFRDSKTDEYLGLHEWYRYGISVETAKYFSEGKYSLFLKTDLTGHLSYQKSIWFYSSSGFDSFTWLAGAGYHLSYPDLYFQASWGKDLYEDTSFEFKMIRSFGELDIGLFSVWNKKDALEEFSGGASVSIPLPFFHVVKGRTHYSSAKRINRVFWYHSGFGGKYPKTDNAVSGFFKRLKPNHILNNNF